MTDDGDVRYESVVRRPRRRAPSRGEQVQFRDSSGATHDAVVVEVTATEVLAELNRSGPAAAAPGQLAVPAGREPLINMLLPRFW